MLLIFKNTNHEIAMTQKQSNFSNGDTIFF